MSYRKQLFPSESRIGRDLIGPIIVVLGLILIFFVPQYAKDWDRSQVNMGLTTGMLLLIAGAVLTTYIMVVRQQKHSPLPEDLNEKNLKLAFRHLSQNYDWMRYQTVYSFTLSAIFMTSGMIVIVFGAMLTLMDGFDGQSQYEKALTFISGILLEFISGSIYILYKSNSARLENISGKLQEFATILTAFDLAGELPDSEQITKRADLIDRLTILTDRAKPTEK